jgi:hypothetical protein
MAIWYAWTQNETTMRRMSTMDTLKTVHQYDQLRLGRCHLARGRAWRIQGLSQPTDTIPCERGIIEPWAGEII